jgi:hypothetical protein
VVGGGGASGQEGTTGMEIDPLVIKAPHQGVPAVCLHTNLCSTKLLNCINTKWS